MHSNKSDAISPSGKDIATDQLMDRDENKCQRIPRPNDAESLKLPRQLAGEVARSEDRRLRTGSMGFTSLAESKNGVRRSLRDDRILYHPYGISSD